MTATVTDAAVRDLYTALLEAWNERNAADYAALLAADGALVGFDGSQTSSPSTRKRACGSCSSRTRRRSTTDDRS
jgi:hypothetical protein